MNAMLCFSINLTYGRDTELTFQGDLVDEEEDDEKENEEERETGKDLTSTLHTRTRGGGGEVIAWEETKSKTGKTPLV